MLNRVAWLRRSAFCASATGRLRPASRPANAHRKPTVTGPVQRGQSLIVATRRSERVVRSLEQEADMRVVLCVVVAAGAVALACGGAPPTVPETGESLAP